MAIADNDTVILAPLGATRKPNFGKAFNVDPGVGASVVWETGEEAGTSETTTGELRIPVDSLRKVLPPPPDVATLLGKPFRIVGGPQEAVGVLAEAFITELDDGSGDTLRFVLLLLNRNGVTEQVVFLSAPSPDLAGLEAVLLPLPLDNWPRF